MIKEEIILTQAGYAARDQGKRPTCIAFALSEIELAAAPGVSALSPEYLYQSAAQQTPDWVPDAGVPLGAAMAAATAGLPCETDYPYQTSEPALPIPPLTRTFSMYGLPVYHYAVDISQVIQTLRNGNAVGLGLELTNSFYRPVSGIITFEANALPGVLHAVVAVGLGWDGSDPFFLIRNSWGAAWGVRGNAWLPVAYAQAHALCTFGV